jgi:hypothetical protein
MEDAVNTGFVARNVLIDKHTYEGDPKNENQHFELIQPECREMVQQIKQTPIPLLMNHGKDTKGPPVRIGQIFDAKFIEKTGDMAVKFRVPRNTIADEGYWQMLKTVARVGGEPWELSLRHTRGNPPIAREVSMCLKGARYGTTIVASSDPEMKTAKYNNIDVCKSLKSLFFVSSEKWLPQVHRGVNSKRSNSQWTQAAASPWTQTARLQLIQSLPSWMLLLQHCQTRKPRTSFGSTTSS